MSERTWTVTLKPESPFAEIFRGGIVPVTAASPILAELEGEGLALVYMLDADRCGSGELEDVAGTIAALRGGRVADIRDTLIEKGCPIGMAHIAQIPEGAVVFTMQVVRIDAVVGNSEAPTATRRGGMPSE